MIPYRTDAPSRGSPIVTMALILANVAVFFYELGLTPQANLYFVYTYALVPAVFSDPTALEQTGIVAHPYLTLVTNTFMHAGALHLIFNMWVLWLFGAPLEDRLGRIRFTFLYFLCGVLASYGYYVSNSTSTIPVVGASGAIAGILGGCTYLFPKARVYFIQPIFIFPLFFRLPAPVFTIIWFALQLLPGVASLGNRGKDEVGGVAWWAHITGFVVGLLMVWLMCRWHAGSPPNAGATIGGRSRRSPIPDSGGGPRS